MIETLLNKIKEKLGIRSPSLESIGYYQCENCTRHAYCDCDFCQENNTVVCTFSGRLVPRSHTCKHFKRIVIKQLGKKLPRGLRRNLPIIDEWCDFSGTMDEEKKDGSKNP